MPPHLPGYHLTQELHTGHTTVVYRGTRVSDATPVIVKMLRDDQITAAEVAELRHEYAICGRLNLPGVVRAYALEYPHDRPALILEDFGGESLAQQIDSGKTDLAQWLRIALTLADALGTIHAHAIIHKDIKPQNIIYNPYTGQVKITDFGIATRLTRESPGLLQPEVLEGTLAYLSPEQTGRMNRSVDHRSDLYSLGVTLYELLTGHLPFDAHDPVSWVHSHIARAPIPPEQFQPDIPSTISAILLKLLAKVAEDRYQSTTGLLHDLRLCQSMLEATDTVGPLAIGQYDPPIRLQLAQKLYGRDSQIADLLEAFERVNLGKPELFLVAGSSGIGKSALVNEIHKVLVELRGYFISGKFDQLRRDIPYASLIQAFQELVRQVLAERSDRIVHWRERLHAVLEGNGQVLIDVIPEIELIIGPQPHVAELPPTQAQNRFGRVFRQFIGAFARPEHPLIIFLDDLQWADLASLSLIELLIGGTSSEHLFVIGAYRNHEVDPAHPLMLTLTQLQRAGATIRTVELEGLTAESITAWLCDTLHCATTQAHELAALLLTKTGGNPFFLNQFLTTLYDEQLLAFDATSGSWRWDISEIEQRAMTDNMLELMNEKIRRLEPSAQAVLKLAACIGNRFDLATLATFDRQTPEQTAARLWPAIAEGLILPIGDDYKLAELIATPQPTTNHRIDRPIEPITFHDLVHYRFLHDRVQQAAYTFIPEEQRQAVHLDIGLLLLSRAIDVPVASIRAALVHVAPEAPGIDEHLFDIVGQLNAGAGLIEEPAEQAALAALNLRAGQRAMSSTAYGAALSYFRTGLSLLHADSWDNRYTLTLALHQAASQAASLNGNYDLMERLVEKAMAHAATPLDRVHSGEVRIPAYIAQNRSRDSVEMALQLLQMLGIRIPEHPTAALIKRRSLQILKRLEAVALSQAKGLAVLAELPQMSDPSKLAAMRILAAITAAVYNTQPALHPIITCIEVNLILDHGNPPTAPYVYTSLATTLAWRATTDNFELCFRLGDLALELLHRFDARPQTARVFLNVYAFIRHWRMPSHAALEPLREGYRIGLETGDFEFGGICAYAHSYHRLISGHPLIESEQEADFYSAGLRAIRRERPFVLNEMIRGTMLALLGLTGEPYRIEAPGFAEDSALQRFQAISDFTSLGVFHTIKLMLCIIAGAYDQAQSHAVQARLLRTSLVFSLFEPLIGYYGALSDLALGLTEEREQRIQQSLIQLKHWAKGSPSNYLQKYTLVQAEYARVRGLHPQARELYDEAIRAAQAGEFSNDEALACELAGRYYNQRQLISVSRAYFRDARAAYLRWGAQGKVAELDRAMPDLLPSASSSNTNTGHTSEVAIMTRTIDAARTLDLATVMRAAQAIAGEIRLEQLIERLLQVVIENAGAQRGALILGTADQLVVEAEAQIEPSSLQLTGGYPLEQSEHLPVAVINYVARTRRSVVLADAVRDSRFAHDPYVAIKRPASLIAMPLLNQGVLTGVVYLENNLASDAFSPSRLEVLGLLAGQAATAIANARLYAEVDESRSQLEERVAERTRELRESNLQLEAARDQAQQANQAKSSFLSNMSHELRTPLNAIIGYSDMLIEDVDETGAPHVASDLRKIRTAGQHLLSVINDILDLSKIEAGKMALYIEPFAISTLIQEVVSTIEPLIEKRGNTLQINLQKLPDGSIMRSDLTKARQILFNLLSNASKFTEQGIIKLRVWQLNDLPNQPMVAFEVQDSGIGMTDEQRERLFQPFMQADLSTTRKYGGTGLGLTITRYFCHMLGGTIHVASASGSGSTFTVMLPLTTEQG